MQSEENNYYVDDSIWLNSFNDLQPSAGQTIVEYVWIGGKGDDLRSKARSLDKVFLFRRVACVSLVL